MLLRPLYLQELSLLLQKRDHSSQSVETDFDALQNEEVRMMKLQCLEAARNNCKILLDLSKHEKLGRLFLSSKNLIFALSKFLLPPMMEGH